MKGYYYILMLILISSASCRNAKDNVAEGADNQAKRIVQKAIDNAGGLEAWRQMKTIRYTKRSRLLLEDGTVESKTVQYHTYTMQPEFMAHIKWQENGRSHTIEHSATGTTKKIDGVSIETLSEKALKETVMSALYTLGMPFKLRDEGTHLSYEGDVTLRDGEQASMIKATYNSGEYEKHSTSDIWWYYFDRETGRYLAAMVYHPPTYAYIENVAFHSNLPIRLPAHRKSYRTDSLRNIKFLRAEFRYSDVEIEMAGE